MNLTGTSFIGQARGSASGTSFHGVNPATGEALEPNYYAATSADVAQACELAASAARAYGATSGADRATFLRAIADNIEAAVDQLVEVTTAETGYPEGRIRGESGRTMGQLRLFATVAEEGSWVDARVDRANPDREPMPKPDVRCMLRSIGPVVVFGASNFPMAFGALGGDTASALAGGNPVVVKGHPAHPRTSEIVADCTARAAASTGMPDGTFSLLFDDGIDVGIELVKHPAIKAVGFTGSLRAGRALMDIAAARPEPIPVYAEMGSINPVFILPGALAERGAEIATGLTGSVNLGVGQFCTCPGVVVSPSGDATDALASAWADGMQASAASVMLTQGISKAYHCGTDSLRAKDSVSALANAEKGEAFAPAGSALFRTTADAFLADAELGHEVFGPSSLLVEHNDKAALLALAEALPGQLTASIHGTEADLSEYAELVDILSQKAGRLVFNGFPTGVEVCHAMVHGGPYPASSDGRSTSVGTMAISRFARPVAYQAFPDAALPDALKDANPLGITRLEDGKSVNA